MQKTKILFFRGRNTPLKRYVSYFLKIRLVEEVDVIPKVVLCHSRGFEHAVQYCIEHDIKPTIVVMDGIKLEIPEGLKIIIFRPSSKTEEGDEEKYSKIYYYDSVEQNSHYPYRIKKTRDKIEKIVLDENTIPLILK